LLVPFGYFRIIVVGAAGYLVFAEVPTANALVGAAMIIVSTLTIAEREARRGRTGGPNVTARTLSGKPRAFAGPPEPAKVVNAETCRIGMTLVP
jgi:hypothetical protein